MVHPMSVPPSVPATEPSTAPPVLLIHGVGSSFEHNWREPGWVDLLSEAGRTVIGVELPGHGEQATRGEPEQDAAELVIASALASGVVDAVGFSAGGYALLTAASRRPELFRRIALMGISLNGLTAPRDSSGGLSAALLDDDPTAAPMVIVIRRLIQTAGNDPQLVARFLSSGQPRPALADLAQVSAQTLFVEGSEDATGSAQGLAAAIPGAQHIVLKGVDHFAIPADFYGIDAVLGFLDS
jgi:pimeloyl-ACP methyl ester carboxylesterase